MKYKAVFWVIPKNTSANLCKPIYDIINYYTSCPFQCEKEGKKIEKFEDLENRKSLFAKIKSMML